MKFASVTKFLIGLSLGMILAALVAFNTLLVWVATGPRSLENVTPYIEKALVGSSGLTASIGQTWLVWGGWQHPIDVRLKQVALLEPGGAVFSSFPELSLGLDLLALPFGWVLPTSLSVTQPVIRLKQAEDQSLMLSNTNKDSSIDDTASVLSALVESLINPKSESSLRKLRTVELIGAKVTVERAAGDVLIDAPDTTLILRKISATELKALLRTTLNYGEQPTPVQAEFSYNRKTRRLEGSLDVSQLHPARLATLVSHHPLASALQFPLSGKIGFGYLMDGTLDALSFSIHGGRGKIIHAMLDGELPVDKLTLVGTAGNRLTDIRLQTLKGRVVGSDVRGTLRILRAPEGLGISGELGVKNVATEQVHRFWPLGLAPQSREWVTSNIRHGMIPDASLKLAIKPGDLALPVLPQQAVDARVELRGAEVRYLPDHPSVRAVDADVAIDGVAMRAAIARAAAFEDTRLTNGQLVMPDMNEDNPLMELAMAADASVPDVVTLLGLPMFGHAKKLNLDAKQVAGRAVGSANLGFRFFSRDAHGKETPISYAVKAQLSDVRAPMFLGRFDVEAAQGELQLDERQIVFSGAAVVNGSSMSEGHVRYSFVPESGIDTTIKANAMLSDAILARFGLGLPLGLTEPKKVAFEAKLSTAGAATAIPSFSLTGLGIEARGELALAAGGQDVASLALSRFKFADSDLSRVEYKRSEAGAVLVMEGATLSIRDYLQKDGTGQKNSAEKKEEDGFSFARFPAIDLTLALGRVLGAQGKSLSEVKGKLVCNAVRCTRADISAQAGGGPLRFVIRSERGQRVLDVTAQQAGYALAALGVIDSMEGGVLSLTGRYEDANNGQLTGQLAIHDYTLVNAPVLAKMLSLASLTGFFDTLSGKGIGFKKLKAPFTLGGDVLTLKDAKAYGSAMGLSADGTITFPKKTLALEGNIVPSYTLNNVVGNVPLLGDILTGGEGQGVFAARYSMKGEADNPEVMVNPLSILTPGFLRNMFDVF